MKLYFYFLELNGIKVEECEVYEKPKTYYPRLEGFPKEFSGKYVKKEHIGQLLGYDENIIVLEGKDAEFVCNKFENKCKDNISNAKKYIGRAEGLIYKYEKLIEMIGEWREKNA